MSKKIINQSIVNKGPDFFRVLFFNPLDWLGFGLLTTMSVHQNQ